LEVILKLKAKENLKPHSKEGYQKSEKAVDTLKETAQAIGTSHDTLHKVKVIAKAKPELLDKVDSGDRSVHSVYTQIKNEEARTKRDNNKLLKPMAREQQRRKPKSVFQKSDKSLDAIDTLKKKKDPLRENRGSRSHKMDSKKGLLGGMDCVSH